MEKQKLLNVDVNNLNLAETIHAVERLIEKGTPSYLVEVNVDVAVKAEKDPVLKRIITEANLVLVDGKPLIWASKFQKRPVKEKISGSDLVPVLLGEAEKKDIRYIFLEEKRKSFGKQQKISGEAIHHSELREPVLHSMDLKKVKKN